MKNKKISFTKLGIFLLGISLFLWNCNEDNLQSEIKQTITNSIEQLSVADAIKEISLDPKLSKTFTKKQSLFNQINSNVSANKTYLSNQSISYSFLLKPKYKKRLKNNELYFDNLFVTIDKDNNAYTHILRYIPTKNWLNNSRDLAKYSGKIQYLSNDREILSSIELVEGTVSENYNNKSSLDKRSQRSGGCQLKYVMTVCGALEGNDLSCTHFYELKCGGASYSGGFSDNGGSNYGDTNNENDFNPGGGSISASPIIAICSEGMYMDSNGNCVSDDDDQIDASELTGKAECLNNKLTKNGNTFVKDILKKFQGDSKFDINIKSVDKIFRTGTTVELNGQTTYVKGSSLINIKISTSKLSNMPALAAARTLIHEYIHADMYRKINTTNYDGDLDFKTTYEEYEQSEFEASPQHNTMADLYVNSIRDALINFHKNILTGDYNYLTDNGTNPLPNNFYEALAWQGLKDDNVKAYRDLSNAKKTELTNALNAHYHSTTKNCPK